LRIPSGKQERRGGIETRSRSPSGVEPPEKQERRGGIETDPEQPVAFQDPQKQERRGGIETALYARAGFPFHDEAGTPWWH